MEILQVLLKLILAIALGGLIGLEREASQKPAGFRTNILVCIAATMMMSLATLLVRGQGRRSADTLVRMAAGVITGIGFHRRRDDLPVPRRDRRPDDRLDPAGSWPAWAWSSAPGTTVPALIFTALIDHDPARSSAGSRTPTCTSPSSTTTSRPRPAPTSWPSLRARSPSTTASGWSG
ncbi:MAG: MgtC/SapB family protein [Candidatus Moduliflexus flocculans]|nr:MgtC/SapB family protein [Candidatus Moduliflexus flocculans]